MVLQIEESSPLQGALTMASRSHGWNEESLSNGSSLEESLNYPELQTDDTVHFYPPVHPPVYVPYVPSSSYFFFPYQYGMCPTVLPKDLSMESYDAISPQKEPSLEDKPPKLNEALSPVAESEEPSVLAPIAESGSSENVHLQCELKLLSPRYCSISSRQFPGHPVQRLTWTFDFPAQLCGRLIGKKGRNIRKLMQDTHTHVTLCKDEEDEMNQLLQVCGAESQVLEAVRRIEELFAGKGNSLSFQNSRALPVVHPTGLGVVVRQMELPTNVEVDVTLSCVINAGHFYLMMPKFDPASIRSDFEAEMNRFYESAHIPRLPLESTLVGTYCVGNLEAKWFRMQIIGVFTRARKVEVLLLDYGQFAILPFLSLRKMRFVSF